MVQKSVKKSNVGIKLTESCFQLEAKHPLTKFDEIILNYPEITDFEYIVEYGFCPVEGENSKSFTNLTKEDFINSARFMDAVKEILNNKTNLLAQTLLILFSSSRKLSIVIRVSILFTWRL